MQTTLYKQEILDHYKNPKNFGNLVKPTESTDVANLSCGDEVHLEVNVHEGVVEDIKFNGTGCAISIASASILFAKVKGMSVNDAKKVSADEVLQSIGMTKESGRVKCALIGFEALKKVLK